MYKRNYQYGSKEWFENKFKNLDQGDGWGHSFRSSQKYRMRLCLDMLDGLISKNDNLNILDIGCATCDFTKLVYKINKNNKIFASDISENAVRHNSNKFVEFEHSVQKLPVLNFTDSNFDVIIALEVINYLTPKERDASMISIKAKLKHNSSFLFSTVISDNSRYFTEREALNLIEKYFRIAKVNYNYSKLWEYFEYVPVGILTLNSIYSKGKIREILYLTNNTFLRKLLTNKKFIYFFFPLIKILSTPSKSFLRNGVLLSFVNMISKILLRNSGKSHVIVLAQKID